MLLEEEQKKNETAHHRIIGLTLETRPDLIGSKTIKQMRFLGCTRVELGVQHTNDKILKKIRRGHTLARTKQAVALLRSAGFKVDFHLMPQLPGSSPQKDYQMFKKVFTDPDLRPDMIKIYPCAVIAGSPLYHWHKKGKYHSYSTKKLIDLLIRVKSELIPYYCRISRLIRDIPATDIVAGNRVTNLREVIQAEMKKSGLRCKCLRCREIGHQKNIQYPISNIQLFIDSYGASGGTEYFLSYEDTQRRVLYAFCRLRVINETMKQWSNETIYSAFIRELHTYGQLVGLGKRDKKASQHQGLGRQMLAKAEEICWRQGVKKLAVIAGIGARGYYRKLGYRLENTYMVKNLKR